MLNNSILQLTRLSAASVFNFFSSAFAIFQLLLAFILEIRALKEIFFDEGNF
jgi:hypothetical protein